MSLYNKLINSVMRKISTKPITSDDKPKKLELKNSDNEYYLPHPQIRIVKTPIKESAVDHQKDKHFLKYPRKISQNGPFRTLSTANFKSDIQNLSKQQDPTSSHKSNAAKKVQTRKIRCNSNCETPRKISSKSCFQVQLNNLRKEGAAKRLNLKIETPTTKKQDKSNLRSMNFDSYYNNDGPNLESKTARAVKRPISMHSHFSSSSQLSTVFHRCKKLIEEYQQQLQIVKRQNKALHEQNDKLRQQKQVLKNPSDC